MDHTEAPETKSTHLAEGYIEVKKRRVAGKTPAEQTVGLPLNPQITKQEHMRLRGIAAEKKRTRKIEDNRANAKARRAVIEDPAFAHGSDEVEPDVEDDEVDLMALHPSHDLKQMRKHAITFRNTCSHWAWHNKHSKLTKRCEPLKRGNQCVLRLLQCGVVPCKGAKIPSAFKKRNWGPVQKK